MYHSHATSDAFECICTRLNDEPWTKPFCFVIQNQWLNELLCAHFYSQKSDISQCLALFFVFAKHIIVGRLFRNIHSSLQYSSHKSITMELFIYWILTCPQPHKVTSGRGHYNGVSYLLDFNVISTTQGHPRKRPLQWNSFIYLLDFNVPSTARGHLRMRALQWS